MKHTYRFFADFTDGTWIIDPSDIIHITKVLRLQKGEPIELFDGKGNTSIGFIESISGKNIIYSVNENYTHKKNDFKLGIAIGALKPGFIDDMLPSLIELDMDEIHVFLQNSTAKSRLKDKIFERWKKISISSCKQCKRPFLPAIKSWPSVEEMINATEIKNFTAKFTLVPGAKLPLIGADIKQQTAFAVIGGEKGFTEAEEKLLLTNSYHPVSLGSTILRAYTAGITVASILSAKSKF
jgi:16S rRNA (uracil1498-N3)-methyltransferase